MMETEWYEIHMAEILEVKARLLRENKDGELYIDDPDQEAENDAIAEVKMKHPLGSEDEMNKLYQTIEKEHMEQMTGEKIDDEEWLDFVARFEDAFAEQVSELALVYWDERKMYEGDEE
jgi:hypothetical protein